MLLSAALASALLPTHSAAQSRVQPQTSADLVALAQSIDGRIGIEQHKLDRPTETIGAIGNDLFGESVDLYSGSTQFTVTDIDLPGNGGPPVRLARSLKVEEGDWFAGIGGLGGIDNTDGRRGWQLEVPYMVGTFADDATLGGWRVGPTGSVNRCSVSSANPVDARPPTVNVLGVPFLPQEYWHGYQMYVPGAGMQEVLHQPASTAKPSNGGPWYWSTKNFWSFRCIPLAHGGTGEGFVARSPDGTEYRFDRMMVKTGLGRLSSLAKSSTSFTGPTVVRLNRNKVYLVATEVRDRFGNWVAYN